MFSFPAGCVGISLSFQEDPVNYCQQIYIFFILATLSTMTSFGGLCAEAYSSYDHFIRIRVIFISSLLEIAAIGGVFISSLICLVQQLLICRRSGDRHFRMTP